MIVFLKKNWKALVFSLSCIGIILIDQYILLLPLRITFLKIGLFAFLHALFIIKINYVFYSDIYKYMLDLKTEMLRGHVYTPFLGEKQSSIIFFYFYIILLLLVLKIKILAPYILIFQYTLLILATLLLIDMCWELFRAATCTANLSKIFVPHTLRQTRHMFKFLTKIWPICTALAKGISSFIGISEIIYPMTFGDLYTIGPLTKIATNNIIYPECKFPIRNKFELHYESYKTRHNEAIEDGTCMSEILPERYIFIDHREDFKKMGISESTIEAICG